MAYIDHNIKECNHKKGDSMKRVMNMLLSFVLLFTALFSHMPMIISAEETEENEISIQETLPEEEKTEEDEQVETIFEDQHKEKSRFINLK